MKSYSLPILILLLSLVGCSRPPSSIEPTLDSSISGKTFSSSENQKFTLQLDVHFDGGYQWAYSISDTKVVRVDSTSFAPKSRDPKLLGGLAIQTLFFRTLQPGQSVVYLTERRSWEKDVAPIDSLTFTVVVSD
jgi:predicted secreted protein